jgi:hypothetical protein
MGQECKYKTEKYFSLEYVFGSSTRKTQKTKKVRFEWMFFPMGLGEIKYK